MKKKLLALLLCLGVVCSLSACGNSTSEETSTTTTTTTESTTTATESEPDAAADYPGKELRIIVPFATGGALDVQARLTAQYLADVLDTTVVVEDIAGAAGVLGTTEYLSQEADTTTILLMSSWLNTVYPLFNEVLYTSDDFLPIIDHNSVEFLLFTNPDKTGIETMDDLIAYAADKGRIVFSSDGVGGSTYIVQNALYQALGIEAETIVVTSTSEGVTNLMAGTVDVAISAINTSGDYVSNGDIVPVMSFGSEPYSDDIVENIPCASDYGVDVSYQGFYYFAIRSGTDQAIVDKLYDAFATVYADPDFIAERDVIGFYGSGMTGDEISIFEEEYTEMALNTFDLG